MLEQKDLDAISDLLKVNLEATENRLRAELEATKNQLSEVHKKDIVESEKTLLDEIKRLYGNTDKKIEELQRSMEEMKTYLCVSV